MLTLALYALLAVLVGIGLFLLAAHVLPAGEQIAPALRDEPSWKLPAERHLSAHDVAGVRLPVALRGYRFAETDLLLDRLAEELRARDEEIARLRGGVPSEHGVLDEPQQPQSTATAPAADPEGQAVEPSEPSEPSGEVAAGDPVDPVDAEPGRHSR